ncbi:hypothetical protein NPS01_25560 [Nocardioides psychrotolerans]|uniref:Phage tail tape measure protein, TP901 family, core region n=1 Tax=Nocardioides psychrotolerans TaxID=1005945 RepID=A0A1I3LR02_9ACTN|nr:phage tail tape measure protein [Nocardioides psychrotolerans]GEP38893.1 hypothetical protein NPS01_25560 [Nocardioides psychrotolerans]SFI87122.1 phage tail tape measure protein, TP901 family, core region [Nocardioides psychrotolerans]
MSAEVRSVVVKLSMENAQYIAAAIASGDAQVKAMGKAKAATMSQGQAIDSLGGKAGKIGLVAAAGLGLMAKAAMDWESQWAGVTKTVDGTGAQLNELEGDLRDLATSLPATHEEIAGVAEAAGQLGVAREDITAFTKTMIDLSETTNLTADQAATDIAQISNVMGTGVDDVDNFGAALVALGNDGASTEAQILGMAQRIAGAGAQIGLAESDILAIANAAASMGIEVEAGGSAISRVFTDMAKATAQGGAELDKFAAVAGMTAAEFATAFESDPAQAFASFTTGLDRINQAGGDVFTTLDGLGLSDVRVSQALLGMAASGDLLTDSLALGASAWEENTALADEAAKRYDTTAAKTQVAWNKIKDAGIEAGGALLPVVAEIADGVGMIADAFGSLPAPVQGALTKLLAITAVVGGAAWFGSKVISGVTETREAIRGLGTDSGTAGGKLRGLGIAASIAVGLYALDEALDAIAESTDRAVPGVEGLTNNLLNMGKAEAMKALAQDFGDLGAAISALDDPGIMADIAGFYDSIPLGLGGLADNVIPGLQSTKQESREAAASIKALDDALAGIVAAGAPDQAAAALEGLAGAYQLTEAEQANLLALLPTYRESLDATANAAILSGEATEGATGATDSYVRAAQAAAKASQEEAQALADATDAMHEKRDATLAAFDAETAYRQALKAAREQGDKNQAGIKGNSAAALENRAVISGLASAWNSQSAAVKNNNAKFREARSAFIETATAMGVPIGKARDLARQLLEIPRSRLIEIQAKTEAAAARLADIKRGIDVIQSKTVTVTVRHQESGTADNAPFVSGGSTVPRRARGGPVFGPGTSTSDSVPILASTGEYVVRAAAVDHYGVDTFERMNALRLAGGGLVSSTYARTRGTSGPGDDALGQLRDDALMLAGAFAEAASTTQDATKGIRRNVEERLEIAQAISGIRDLKRSLNADGKDRLNGLDRKIAQLELQAAERALKLLKTQEQREARQEARDARREAREELASRRDALRGIGDNLSFDNITPDNTPRTVLMDINAEIAQFRADIIEAGGTWTGALKDWAAEMRATAKAFDTVQAALVEETRKRDELIESLNSQQQALDQLMQTMSSYASSVSGNFLSDPFNGGYTTSTPGTGTTPELEGQRSALAAAEAQLIAIRSGPGADSVAAAAEASRLMVQIQAMRASVEAAAAQASEPVETTVTGLQALEQVLLADTAAAERMAAALALLEEKGLDTEGALGGLYEQLAASGDFATAEELAALSEEQIAYYEQLFTTRENAAATVGALATQAVYGEQQAVLVATIAATTAAIAAQDLTIAALNAELATLGAEVRAGAAAGVQALQPMISGLRADVRQIPRETAQLVRQQGGR